MKDWRGTGIEVGKPVLTHSKNFGYGLGTVQQLHKSNLTVHLKESNYWSPGAPKTTLVTIPASVTVLCEDMFSEIFKDKFDELYGRIRELESDVEYYQYEASRTW